jgi:hypothetical protein
MWLLVVQTAVCLLESRFLEWDTSPAHDIVDQSGEIVCRQHPAAFECEQLK